MVDRAALPTYRGMFDEVARTADESRSVYSPAAYLADLLQLVDDHFQDAAITRNRPGISAIPLDPAHTGTEVPYLDVVNDVLAGRLQSELGQDPYQALLGMTAPSSLPFSREDVRRRQVLSHAGVAADELYRRFTAHPDADVVARESLGLSLEDRAAVVTELTSVAEVAAAYGLAGDDIAELAVVERFREQTGLTLPELRALLGGDLGDSATNDAGETERVLAAGFFVNRGEGSVAIDADGAHLVWNGAGVSWPWFGRVARFLRLARKLAMPFPDLDLVLRTCCGNVLDAAALRTIAVVRRLMALYDEPVDVVCSLITAVPTAGVGDGEVPADLFDRTFNGARAAVEKAVILGGPFRPAAYADLDVLACHGDVLDPRNAAFRRRITAATGLTETDLTTVVTRFRGDFLDDQGGGPFEGPFEGSAGLAALSLLFRIGTLTRTLELRVVDLFGLLDALRWDPSIRTAAPFDLLIDPVTEVGSVDPDPVRILVDGAVPDRLWLVQILLAAARWASANDITGAELPALLGAGPQAVDPVAEAAAIAAFDGLYQQFQGVLLTPATFLSDRFGGRDAAVVHQVLAGPGGPVVDRDHRLVRDDVEVATAAAFAVLPRLAQVTPDDLLGLGIEDRLQEKIFANLVLRGYLQADGTLVESRFPAAAADFRLAGSFPALRDALFTVMCQLRLDTAEEVAGEVAEQAAVRTVVPDTRDPATFFPSDLRWVDGLDPADDAELYNNLVYNRYLDADGRILRPDVFATSDDAGATTFVVDADLGPAEASVWAHIHNRLARFVTDPLVLDGGVFAGLGLDDAATGRLMANLRFNGHLTADATLTDKVGLLALGRDRLDVALEFYPQRRAILEALQDRISTFRTGYLTFAAESFRPLAERALAEVLFARLGPAPGNGDLGPEFGPTDREAVRLRLAAIDTSQRRFRFDPAALAALDFDPDETTTVIDLLRDAGDLTADSLLPPSRVPFFLDVHGALTFTVDGFGDYAKDIFFLLHALAKETAAATAEITAAVTALARAQHMALFAGLQDVFGVSLPVVEVMCSAVCGSVLAAVDVLVAPVLAAGTDSGHVTVLPADARLRLVFRRLAEFAAVAARLNLDAVAAEIAFRDRDLVGRFPERLTLPPGVTTFDALLPSGDGTVYLFTGTTYWTYSAATYALLSPAPLPLTVLSHRFAGLVSVDAAVVEAGGTERLVGRDGAGVTRTFVREGHSAVWEATRRIWGAIRNVFADPARIDTAFQDREGKTYLFSGDQYVRYSGPDYTEVDPGYPRLIAGNWVQEGLDTQLPAAFRTAVDASFQGLDGVTYLFKGGRYLPSADPSGSAPVSERWGHVRNTFRDAPGVDAAFTHDGAQLLLRGDQLIRYTDAVENAGVHVDEGYPRRLESQFPNLPVEFESGVQAAFTDAAGVVHLFKNGRAVAVGKDGTPVVSAVNERWGQVGPVLPSGTVDAAFVGLDGKTYLFSGERYIRYSGSDYSAVDPGFPRTIAGDWGGMRTVTASFVLDEKTYLFGAVGPLFTMSMTDEGTWAEFAALLDAGDVPLVLREGLHAHDLAPVAGAPIIGASPEWVLTTGSGTTFTVRRVGTGDAATVAVTAGTANGERFFVRYSTKDYDTPDAGYPRPLDDDNWWDLPASLFLGDGSLAQVDAVFTGTDKQTYLFVGERFVVFDNRERWWSEPRSIGSAWDSLPFERVDAAFVGTDGRTYVFSGSRYVRYRGADYSRVDDRYPNEIATFWGTVTNHIARTGIVDAAVVLDSTDPVDGVEHRYTYLFSGNQYVRYDGDTNGFVDNGYPKSIAASLTGEPRFAHLTAPVTRVDAVLADRRTVHVFAGGDGYAVSDTLYRRYAGVLAAAPGCAFLEDGSLLVEDGSGWNHVGAIEGAPIEGVPAGRTPVRPRTLRAVPERFRSGLSAVLNGVDDNTYLFSGTSCFDVALGREYPAAQDWGRPRNTVAQRGAVDAGFVGRDGRTYVFSGDQFVAYSGDTYVDAEIEGRPQDIAARWGGLGDVAIAFVDGDLTYVCESPDADGTFRYVVYSGTDYTQPDPGYPRTAGADFWGIPQAWRDEGFARIAAVLVDRGNRIFLTGTRFVQHTAATGAWSLPHPLSRLWPDLPFGDDATAVESAFVGADGTTYLFAQRRFVGHNGTRPTAPAPIEEHWGHVANNFAAPTRGTLVDAAFVDRGTTYLFSGDQFVRYSGADYRYVDTGYPKLIGELREEECFANLPDDVENLLADRVATGAETIVDAVVGNPRTVTLFIGPDAHVVSRSLEGTLEQAGLGRVRNTLADTGRVDASFVAGDHTFLFAGDQYVRYTGDRYADVDEGYPRAIETALPADIGVAALPAPFVDGIDAALAGIDGRIHLFAGPLFLTNDTAEPASRPIVGTWGTVRNGFEPAGAIDAAFVAADGRLYAFVGNQYVRYTDAAAALADDGYPRLIKDDWGDLPVAYEDGIDAAFRFEGRSYFLRGDEYVRYSDPEHRRMDRLHPQPLAARWGPWVDYRLADLVAISRFVQLHNSHSDADGGLAGVLTGFGTVEDPYQRLADLFGFAVEDVAWVVRHRGFLPTTDTRGGPAARVDIDLIGRLVDLFAVTGRLGDVPSAVYEQVWRPLHDDALAPDLAAAAAAAHRMFVDSRPESERPERERLLHRELNEASRDALVAATIVRTDGVGSPDDLFDLLLLDVEMGGEATTSAVREAIAATQLFFRRYFLDLQPVTLRSTAGKVAGAEAVKDELRAWWKWMKNYRVWENNRQVYLYPENYLRPELRSTKTPAFATLEKDLLQGDLTPDAVRRAYTSYLDEYTEVSRLTVAGGYVREAPATSDHAWELVLFGRTKTDPRRYYFRHAAFSQDASSSAQWEPWAKVDVRIDSDRVYPVYAFNRVFVFWTGVEKIAKPAPTGTFTDHSDDKGHTYTRESNTSFVVRIYYSFHDLNGVWTPAQQLAMDPLVEESLEVTDVQLLVEFATVMPAAAGGGAGGDVHDNISVRCSYGLTDPLSQQVARKAVAFALTAELFTQSAVPVGFDDLGISQFNSVFDEPIVENPFEQTAAIIDAHPELGRLAGVMARQMREAAKTFDAAWPKPAVVTLNNPQQSDTGRWFAFDHKGGSFLCKPAPLAVGSGATSRPQPVLPGGARLRGWPRVDAGFTAPDGTTFVFDDHGHRFAAITPGGQVGPDTPTAQRWGLRSTGFPGTGVVDAVVVHNNRTFAFSGGDYVRFTGDAPTVLDADYPRKIRGNPDGLPNWTRVEAAFTGLDGRTYFFQGESFVDGATPSRKKVVRERWGRRVEGSAAGQGTFDAATVTAALVIGDHTFLIAGNRYVRYTGGAYEFIDAGYPRDLAGNPDGLPTTPDPVVFTHNATTYSFDNAARTFTVARPGQPPTQHPSTELGGATTLTSIEAACVVGNHVYLAGALGGDPAKDTAFVRYTVGVDGAIGAYIDPGYPKRTATVIDALAVIGGELVVFSGDSYGKIPATQELDTAVPMHPVDGAWANLPHEFRRGVGGAIDTAGALYLLSGDRYVSYARTTVDGVAPQLPFEQVAGQFEIIRITTGTASTLNQRMFAGGVAAVVDASTQETDERPSFDTTQTGASVIKVKSGRVDPQALPVSSHLDFDSANGIYYWEIFFHAPLLIADTLRAAQRFEDAVEWFEYIFDPTRSRDHWRFLPFRETDVEALVDSCVADLAVLGIADAALAADLARLRPLAAVFAQEREVSDAEGLTLRSVPLAVAQRIATLAPPATTAGSAGAAWQDLRETGAIIGRLDGRYRLMNGGRSAAIRRYLDDPFDPHAIAAMRTGAYRRTVVMAYIDNLIEWGDTLFRQYTPETVDQARMLYVLAKDLLGPAPDDLGARPMRVALNFGRLTHTEGEYDFLVRRAAEPLLEDGPAARAVHTSIAAADPADPDGSSYFVIPENTQLADYWTRVDDRLGKIRKSLDILGVRRALPLFDPPSDPMAMVRATALGGSLDAAAAASVAVPAPHHRFTTMLLKAQELADRVSQFGGDLAIALEKHDAEAMTVLQNTHDGIVLDMNQAIREASIGSAAATIAELAATHAAAAARQSHYQSLIDTGRLPVEIAQLVLIEKSVEANAVASVLKLGAGIAHAFPQSKIGLFNFGMEIGGAQAGSAIDKFADFAQTLAGTLSGAGEMLGIVGGHERSVQEWHVQLDIATGDLAQIAAQQDGAVHQLASAQRDLEINTKEAAHNQAVARFLTDKFGSQDLYLWTSGQLSGLYFQAYNLAYDLARQAESAYQFERGVPESRIIEPVVWDSRRSGLLAGEKLSLDLLRLSAAHRDAGARGLEITKQVSLLELDPIAVLGLRATGSCEFSLTEALFDYDFPGQFRRQVRTLSVTLVGPDGQPVLANALLTQLQHKTVLSPDVKAVKHLLDGRGDPPAAVRSDWRASQQIALSQIGDGVENNGLFELRYDDDRYLPFEGTGAVSTWHLELTGRHRGFTPAQLQDVVVTLKYSAVQGDPVFTGAVKGMLKPFPAYRYVDVQQEFPAGWADFLDDTGGKLTIRLAPALFPDMSSRQIAAVYARIRTTDGSRATMTLNGNPAWALRSDALVATSGLTVGANGSDWTFEVHGDHTTVTGVDLVLTYLAKVG